MSLAIDSYHRAVADRPDHPSGHRMLAYALLRTGNHEAAWDALVAGLAQDYPAGRFEGATRILGEDLGLVAAAWRAAEPRREPEIRARVALARVAIATGPSTRFVTTWETDANDVDLHVDLQANHDSPDPTGYGMGALQIIEHDGRGGLRFHDRPFLVMTDHRAVELGTFRPTWAGLDLGFGAS